MATNAVRLKACGGLAPYTWSNTGPATLNTNTGTAVTLTCVPDTLDTTTVTVTVTDAALVSTTMVLAGNCGCSGEMPSGVAYFIPQVCNYYSECGSCGSGNTFISIAGAIDFDAYDCSGVYMFTGGVTGTGTPSGKRPVGPSPYSNMSWTISPNNTDCSGVSENLSFPTSGVFKTACCDSGGTVDWEFTISIAGVNAYNGIVWSGAAPLSGTASGAVPNSVCNVPNECKYDTAWDSDPGVIDVRTQAMVDTGLCNPAALP